MNREKFAWTVSVVLIAILAMQLPGTFAQRDDDYAFVRTLVDIHRQVVNNYVETVPEEKLREGAIEGMLQQLDPFSMYVPPARQEEFDRMLEGSFKGVGIQLEQNEVTGEIEVISPIDGSPALKAGVLAGDVILKVNGESIDGLKLPEVIKKIGGPLGTEVTLTVRHTTGEVVDLKMTRQEIIVPTIKGYSRNPDNSWNWYVTRNPKIAYVRLTQFTPDSHDKLKSVVTDLLAEGMKGLVLDLRFNPGGRLDEAVRIVDLFLERGTIVTVRGRNRPERSESARSEGTLPDFPLIVLVNEHSASASEIVAGSLKDNRRALVIGQRTYGKGSVQEIIPMDSNAGELKLTVAYYYLPSGRLVHRKKDAKEGEWGVEPNIIIPMDPNAERRLLQHRNDAELHHRPMPRTVTSQPTTIPSATSPATTMSAATQEPVDPQLDQAVTTLIGMLVIEQNNTNTTQPATNPN